MSSSPPAGAAVLTVTQITAQIRDLLEGEFRTVWVAGEISSCKRHGSGHVYLDLKDRGAVLKGVIWRSTAQKLGTLPEVGAHVTVRGRISVFLPHGAYQLQIDQIHDHGTGAQDAALRRLKEKLA